jgi:mRNA interferase RelE/StbE
VKAEYRIEFRLEAREDFRNLDSAIRRRILKRIQWLGQHFEEISPDTLAGEEWQGFFKLRAGDYRIIYAVDAQAKKLIVRAIGHRRDIYR